MSKIINVSQAAEMLGVHSDTIRDWEEQGQLKGFRTPGGHRRYRAADVQALIPSLDVNERIVAALERIAAALERIE